MSNRRGIVAAASLLLLGNLASRLLGLVREQVIAAFFSISGVASAFGTANTVPQVFYDLLIGGAVSAALVPVLSSYADQDDQAEFGQIVSTLLIGSAAALAAIVAGLIALATPLTVALGGGSDPASFSLILQFVRVVVPALLFLGLSGVSSAVCYARRWYTFPAFSIALYNGGLIVTILTLQQRLGPSSLVVGALVGSILQFLAVAPGLRGIPLRLTFRPGHPAVRQMLRLYAPVAAGLVVTEIGVLIDRNLAWQTGVSSVAVMRLATTMIQLPLGLVATATSLAVLPVLARLADDLAGFRQVLGVGLRLALLAIIPAGVFLVAFPAPVVRLLFQHGAFDASATRATADAFLLYAPQLPFVAIDQILVYAFYARKNTTTPMLVGLGGVGVYLASALLLIGPFQLGLAGLILANTIQNSLHAIVLLLLLIQSIGSLAGSKVGFTGARALLAGAVALALAEAGQSMIGPPVGLLPLAGYLGGAAVMVLATYLGLLHLFGVEEIMMAPQILRARLAVGDRRAGPDTTETSHFRLG